MVCLHDLIRVIENAVGKYNDGTLTRMPSERKNNFSNSNSKTTSSMTRTASALDKIKDQDYEKQQDEKLRRYTRLKESRRKYSKQKLKSKNRDQSNSTQGGNCPVIQDAKANSKTTILKDSFVKVDKENSGPCNNQSSSVPSNDIKNTKSSSVLIIPRMHSINSTLPKKEKLKIQHHSNYVMVNGDGSKIGLSKNPSQKTYKLLSDIDKSKTQVLSSRINSFNQSSILMHSSVGSADETESVQEVEIEFCGTQYDSVLKLANKLQQEEMKVLNEIKPSYQKSTFSIERKKRRKYPNSFCYPSEYTDYRMNETRYESLLHQKQEIYRMKNSENQGNMGNVTALEKDMNELSQIISQTDYSSAMDESNLSECSYIDCITPSFSVEKQKSTIFKRYQRVIPTQKTDFKGRA